MYIAFETGHKSFQYKKFPSDINKKKSTVQKLAPETRQKLLQFFYFAFEFGQKLLQYKNFPLKIVKKFYDTKLCP